MVGLDCQIYDLARKAKERLKKNNYVSHQPPTKMSTSKTFSEYIKTRHTATKVLAPKKETKGEDEMYLRVCELLRRGHLQNPILSLIDREIFDTLDSEAKQFYIANLTQKFKFMVRRYYKEHN